jgi:hypothetical protein
MPNVIECSMKNDLMGISLTIMWGGTVLEKSSNEEAGGPIYGVALC